MTFRNLLAATALFGVIGGMAVADDAFAKTKRHEVINEADFDNDKRLDGKEMKHIKKNNPKMYDSLVAFCEEAKDHPKKMGVDLPADPSKKQKQCKKKHVAKPFLMAWAEKGQDVGMDGGKPDGPPRAQDGGTREQTGH